MNVEMMLCGLAVPFGERSRSGEREYDWNSFASFLNLEMGLPLMIGHEPIIDHTGVTSTVGAVRRFAIVGKTSNHAAGLLALAEMNSTPQCWSILMDIRRGKLCGLSIGCGVLADGQCGLDELSIVREPNFASAQIFATGQDALELYELLTGERVQQFAIEGGV